MLQRGDLVPHFDVTAIDGRVFRYSTIWQHRNLVLVTLTASGSDSSERYASALAARSPDFSRHNTACIITRDLVEGIPSPGVVVADRWGQIVHLVAESDVAGLPLPGELVDWIEFVESQCPECEGEAE